MYINPSHPYRTATVSTSHLMSDPTLPPELIDHVIDFLADDIEALQNCSLVHSTWLCSCRFHLFSAVQLDSADRAHEFYYRVSTSKDVSQYVRSLYISLRREKRSLHMTHWLDTIGSMILRGLPALTHVSFDPAWFGELSTTTITQLPRELRTLRELDLIDLELPNVRAFSIFMRELPALRTLRIVRPKFWKNTAARPVPPSLTEPCVTHLELDSSQISLWIICAPKLFVLRSVDYSFFKSDQAACDRMCDLLSKCGAEVEDLTLRVPETGKCFLAAGAP